MNFERPKRSVGALIKVPNKTKPLSPDCTGTIRFQRDTIETIYKQFSASEGDVVEANLAGWLQERNGQAVMNVEVSPKFVKPDDVFSPFRHRPDDN